MKYILLVLAVVFLCTGCTGQEDLLSAYTQRNDFYQPDPAFQSGISEEGRQDITDSSMTDFFRTLYGMNALVDQKVYWNGTQLQIDYVFGESASRSEFDAARSFALTKLVLGIQNTYSVSSYEIWMRQDGRIISIPEVICKIFVEEDLIFQDHYVDGSLTGCYENTDVFLKARTSIPANEQELVEFVHKNLPSSKIYIQKSIKDNALLILLEMEEIPETRAVDGLEQYIGDFMKDNHAEYSNAVISLKHDEAIFFRSVYQRDVGQWSSESWFNEEE